MQRSMVLASSAIITAEDLPQNVANSSPEFRVAAASNGSFDDSFIEDFSIPVQQKMDRVNEELELRIIKAALTRANNHRQATADLLGISRKSLHNKMVKYKLFDERGADENLTTNF
jgi:DNA-binding NtrC family response regulator